MSRPSQRHMAGVARACSLTRRSSNSLIATGSRSAPAVGAPAVGMVGRSALVADRERAVFGERPVTVGAHSAGLLGGGTRFPGAGSFRRVHRTASVGLPARLLAPQAVDPCCADDAIGRAKPYSIQLWTVRKVESLRFITCVLESRRVLDLNRAPRAKARTARPYWPSASVSSVVFQSLKPSVISSSSKRWLRRSTRVTSALSDDCRYGSNRLRRGSLTSIARTCLS
jgi:hypothetical protein